MLLFAAKIGNMIDICSIFQLKDLSYMAHLDMTQLDYCMRDSETDNEDLLGDDGKFIVKKNGKEFVRTRLTNMIIADRIVKMRGRKYFSKFYGALMDAVDDSIVRDDGDTTMDVEACRQFYRAHYAQMVNIVCKLSAKNNE